LSVKIKKRKRSGVRVCRGGWGGGGGGGGGHQKSHVKRGRGIPRGNKISKGNEKPKKKGSHGRTGENEFKDEKKKGIRTHR